MIREEQKLFVLDTAHTTYCFHVMDTGHLEHLYYGKKITVDAAGAEALFEKHAFAPGNTNVYDAANTNFSLEDILLEMSSYGKGDIREPFVELVHADGSTTSDFLFEEATIAEGKEAFQTLPGSYDETGQVGHLTVTLRDKQYGIKLELHYYVYEECDIITRSARLVNESKEAVCGSLRKSFHRFCLKAALPGVIGLIWESSVISHRSGPVITRARYAGRKFRMVTATVIPCQW